MVSIDLGGGRKFTIPRARASHLSDFIAAKCSFNEVAGEQQVFTDRSLAGEPADALMDFLLLDPKRLSNLDPQTSRNLVREYGLRYTTSPFTIRLGDRTGGIQWRVFNLTAPNLSDRAKEAIITDINNTAEGVLWGARDSAAFVIQPGRGGRDWWDTSNRRNPKRPIEDVDDLFTWKISTTGYESFARMIAGNFESVQGTGEYRWSEWRCAMLPVILWRKPRPSEDL